MADALDEFIEACGSRLEAMHQLALMSGYEERVPTIQEFVMDPYYLGKSLVDADGVCSVYPIWMDALAKIYPTPYTSPAVEIYLTGGIGLGKSTAAKIITLYDLCKLLCLRDPRAHFKLLPSTVIRWMLMNATKGLSYDVLYAEIIEWIENSPFFKGKMTGGKNPRTLFIKNVDLGFGSRGQDALGQATVGAIFSEINDMTVVHGQAEDNFDTIYTRMNSRFGGKGVEMIGHLILDSSNKGNRSFIDVRLEDKAKKGIHDYLLFRYAHWEAKWHLGGYSGEMFYVYAGDQYRDPFIFDENTLKIKDGLEPSRIISVPVEHRQEFETNIVKSLRDLAGVSTFGTWSFISSYEVLNRAADHINPTESNVVVLDFFDKEQTLHQTIDVPRLAFLNKKDRFIHIDLGLKNDSTGIACSYLDGYVDQETYDPLTSTRMVTREPKIVTEWALEITCQPGQEVPIYKIKNFLIEASQQGYPIKMVTTDGYQSTNLRQDLTLAGFETALLSVDRTKDPYNYLRNSILEGRSTIPAVPKLIKELKELEEGEGKFDHPPSGSKDIADAVCGSQWAVKENIHKIGSTATVEDLQVALHELNKSRDAKEMFRNIIKQRVGG
ncbi:hypothetical protein [Escherichia phage EP_H11]|nr:hypothetical protein [Escherichia phage EP_H11]